MKFLGIALCFLLMGCSLGGGGSSRSYYVLSTPLAPSDPRTDKSDTGPSLLVREATASGFINSQRILYSADPIERRSYQYAYWTEPPPKSFTNLLLTALDQSGAFRSVASGTSSAIADFGVNPRLLSFYHDVSSPPGKVLLEVRVELVAIRRAVVVAQRTFRAEVSAATFDAPGAVGAFSEASRIVVSEIEAWVKGEATENALQAPSTHR